MDPLWLAVPGCAIWAVILLLPWRPWSSRPCFEAVAPQSPPDLGDVTVLIPARNEADGIARTLRALAAQGENLSMVLIDDSINLWGLQTPEMAVGAYSSWSRQVTFASSRITGSCSARRTCRRSTKSCRAVNEVCWASSSIRTSNPNGTFYINYTTSAAGFSGDTVVARYQVANPAADVADVLAVTHIITIDQPQSNHNGGDLHFGPDGYLYIGMGDGGNGNDVGPGHAPEGNAQSPGTLLGKMLRINVRNVPTYTIPPSNPFAQTAGYKPEIWAMGLRNPWRFSFDRATGDMYIGDVGQKKISYSP